MGLPVRLRDVAECPAVIADESASTNVNCLSDIHAWPDSARDMKRRILDGFTSTIDEDEQKSTCSTWDICSTKDGETDIEPELFQRFMKQALRPRWEERVTNDESSADASSSAMH